VTAERAGQGRTLQGTAFVFPGQGSQVVGMGRALAEREPVCRETFAEADDALGFALSGLCFDGPAEDLTLTANTQPAILTVSVAIDRLLASRGLRPQFAAGHSLGEYSALVSAGVLTFADAVRAVRLRGEAMQDAVPAGRGAMAAILGLAPEAVEALCREAEQGSVVSAANFNSPEQTVIAGEAEAVARASKLAVDRGAMRAVALAVSAPFHCALMKPAELRLADHLRSLRFSDPAHGVVANADAQLVKDGASAREALIRQVCSPVRWVASIGTLKALGAVRFVEAGPGKVLSGLMRRIDRSAASLNIEDPESFELALGKLQEAPAETAPAPAPRRAEERA
jgi:[acyl-carrier-protein] S-malonyltransferase